MLDLLEPWDRSPVEEEEVAAGPGVLDGVDDAAEAEVAWNNAFSYEDNY